MKCKTLQLAILWSDLCMVQEEQPAGEYNVAGVNLNAMRDTR